MPSNTPSERIDHAMDPAARTGAEALVSGWWLLPMLLAAVIFWAGVGYALLF